MNGLVSARTRFAALALLSVASLGAAGCGRQAHANRVVQQSATPEVQVAAASGAEQAPPPVVTTTLPPAPVPATFDVAALSERVKPMVVNITTTQAKDVQAPTNPFEFFFGPNGPSGPNGQGGPRGRVAPKQTALGTGFIIDASGYVITNEHVVHDADEVRVRLADERELIAEVVGRDPKLDLALLRLKGASDLPAAPLGSSDQLRVGEHVLAVGNPFGLGHTVTLGIVSAKARSIGAGPYDDFIQTDAAINPGNSGGPLFNWRGEVIGINTAIRAGANSIGFAVPIDALKDILPQLREKGHVERGKLGVVIQPMTGDLSAALGLDQPRGALVAQVEPGGAADRAGIKAGDVIVGVNGVTIGHSDEVPRNVARNRPGTEINVSVQRGKDVRQLKAKLDLLADEDDGSEAPRKRDVQAEPQQRASQLGVAVTDAPGGGARVTSITGEQADELSPGDVITEINGARIKDAASLNAALTRVKPGSTALLKVRRGTLSRFAAVPIPAK
ncbi:Do family serine endopeptidase [Chondromyces apiculatus]|uniref:Serine protease MucD/AlgY associated with sigma factor RpoE n=1 Tax=Chondromyces apiculatus DSM 436 TaxID=1192034 RepID=A0A017TID1_9BACT|nr:Do family serine endopeptidase [Chondromyces apiculatus]EYF08642.1 Serine protease precursor MucD/AlgY associated with sigma factor RpoE [Chondromyces apiculatus DSM 436]